MTLTAIQRSKKVASLARAMRRKAWLRRNRAALEACNDHVKKHGVFSDGLRSF
ncbi:MAG: type II toxin-antitoxin system CcdA family antitoxin [Pseudomonadota bacterium]